MKFSSFQMKSKIFLVMVFALSLVLIACGGSDSAGGPADGDYTQGVTDDEILVGHTAPQTGPAATYDEIRKGIEAYFSYVNDKGGVQDRNLKLIAYDDQYQPAKTVQTTKKLVEEDKVFALLGSSCSSCQIAVIDYLEEKGIPNVMISTGASDFVNPPKPTYMGQSTFNYSVEAKIYLDFVVNELGLSKIAIAYQNDDLGQEAYESLMESIEDYPDVEIVEEVTFLPTDSDYSSQAQKLTDAKPEAVINFATPNPAANLKKAMYKIGLTDPEYIVSTVGADNVLFELAGPDVWEGTYSGAYFMLEDLDPDHEGVQQFIETYKEMYNHDGTPPLAAQHGWATAQVLVEALERTEGDLTWSNFLDSFYTFDKWSDSLFHEVSFSEDNHYGVTSLLMMQAKDGAYEKVLDILTFDPITGEVND